MNGYQFKLFVKEEILDDIPVTVQTGNHRWEEVVDLVYCEGCNQYHVISEAIEKDDTDKKEV